MYTGITCASYDNIVVHLFPDLLDDEHDDCDNHDDKLSGCDEDEVEGEENSVLTISVTMEDMKQGKYRLVYAHPEALLTAPQGRALLRSPFYRNKVSCIAEDEAHMIYEW